MNGKTKNGLIFFGCMNNFYILGFLSVLIIFNTTNAEQKYAISDQDSILCALKKQQYKKAEELLTASLVKDPANMDLWYLNFIVQQTRILDYESYLIEGESFVSGAKKLKKRFENRLKTLHGDELLMGKFYLANITGGIGIVNAKNNNWIDAATNAHQAVTELKAIIKMRPDFIQAYLGIGVFDYYLSRGLKKIIPFMQDKSAEAIKSLQKSLSAGYPFSDAAKSSLCWIMIDQGNFYKADSIAKAALQEYPEQSSFLRTRAYIAIWTGNYTLALDLGCKLINSAQTRNPVNWSDLVTGSYILAYSYNNLGDREDAIAVCKDVLSKSIPVEFRQLPHLSSHFKYIIETLETRLNQNYLRITTCNGKN